MESDRNLCKRLDQPRNYSEKRLERQRASMHALRELRNKPVPFCTPLDIEVMFYQASKLPAIISQAKRFYFEDETF